MALRRKSFSPPSGHHRAGIAPLDESLAVIHLQTAFAPAPPVAFETMMREDRLHIAIKTYLGRMRRLGKGRRTKHRENAAG